MDLSFYVNFLVGFLLGWSADLYQWEPIFMFFSVVGVIAAGIRENEKETNGNHNSQRRLDHLAVGDHEADFELHRVWPHELANIKTQQLKQNL